MPKTVEMKVVFLVEDEKKLLKFFDSIRQEIPRTLAHAVSVQTGLDPAPGTTELRAFFQAGDIAEYDGGAHWLETPGVVVVAERREPDTVKVVQVTSALVIEDEKLLYRAAEWTLSRQPEHSHELLDENGEIDVIECVMALFATELPPGVSGPTDAFEMKEFPVDQARRPGFDFIKAFEEDK